VTFIVLILNLHHCKIWWLY